MDEDLIWLKRSPYYTNLRINAGLRHCSRIHTKPAAFRKKADFFATEQIKIVKNNHKAEDQELILLNECKNIFGKQLPEMGNHYISRLVFDFKAETVLILANGVVCAAITSRLFPEEEFIEIAFVAVESNYQERGFGRLVMSYLKQSMQVYPYLDFIACADNDAVEFFKKMGFNLKEIQIDPKRWVKRIKDYTGVSLAHCKINLDVDYMNLRDVTKKQIKYLENKIGKHFVTFPAVIAEAYKQDKYSPTIASISLPEAIELIAPKEEREKHDIDPYLEELVKDYDKNMADLNWKINLIMNDLESDRELNEVFGRPVTEQIAANYFNEIHHPMDFLTIRRRLERFPDYYKTPQMFASDIILIEKNCKTFNSSDTIFYEIANRLKSQFKKLYPAKFPNQPIK